MTHTGMLRGRSPFGISCIAVSILFVIAVSESVAQQSTATILGAVRDASGAVIPSVSLTARNLETGQTRTVATGLDGSYRFSAMPVGTYEVRAEHAGFRSAARMGLTLSVTQEAVVNFTLEVGAVEQTVEVSAEASLVNTTSGSLGGLVDERKIGDLPLNGRNYADLILLQPGISESQNKGVGTANLGTPFISNGSTVYSNSISLDGASTLTYFAANPASGNGSTLGVDGIREYRVVTNSFSAEYGMTMGSQTIMVSKNGTNAYHGSLFEFLRNSKLDARNFFDYKTALTPGRLPPFKRNNFGASFGGPVVQDKTFFFAVYEGLRERVGLTTLIRTIPPSAKVDGGVGGVPQIAPIVKPFLKYYPDPNLPNNEYTFPFSQPNTDNYGQIRGDQNISSADTMFVRYTVDKAEVFNLGTAPDFPWLLPTKNQYATLSENHIFSPTVLNTFRFSFSRTIRAQTPLYPSEAEQYSFVPGMPMGTIAISSVATVGPRGTAPQNDKQNIFAWSDDLFDTRGRHALKFGTLINRYQIYARSQNADRGTITFPSVNAFLLGQPSTYTTGTPGSIGGRGYEFSTFGFYVQDDVRVRSNLTLNMGLRYEFNTTYHEVQNHNASLRNVQQDATTTIGEPFQNPSMRNFSPRFGFAWDVKGDGRTAVRGGFGLLYDVLANLGNTFHSNTCTVPFCSTTTVNIPASNPVTMTLPLFTPTGAGGKEAQQIDYHLQQPHLLQYNLAVERQLPWDTVATFAYGGSRGINLLGLMDANAPVPQVLADGRKFWAGNEPRINPNFDSVAAFVNGGYDSWYNSFQFSLLKRLSHGIQLQSSYTWSKAMDTNTGQDSNNTTTGTTSRPDASDNRAERAVSYFDLAHNWKFNAIYRLPNLVDSGSVMGKLLNGWGTASILSLQTGYPAGPLIQQNRSRSRAHGAGTNLDRPDITPGFDMSKITSGTTAGCGGVAAGRELGTPDLWFDPCAFSLQPQGFLGNAGRNIVRGPGIFNLHFSLTKDTALGFLGESGRLQFRADFFNILNHANFSPPARAQKNTAMIIFSGRQAVENRLATAGRIRSTNTSARQIQLALRLVF